MLAAIGFKVTPLGARVVWTAPIHAAPLTHSLALITLPEGRFLCDVGFSQTPTAPLQFDFDTAQVTEHGTYRLLRDGEVSELQLGTNDGWKPMYRFGLSPQAEVDYEVANWYTSTHPRSRFTQNLIVCRVVGDRRVNLLNTKLSIRHPDGTQERRDLADALDLAKLLDEFMDLAPPVPADAIWARLRLATDSAPAV